MAYKTLLVSICFLLYRSSYGKEQSCAQENPCLCRFNELQKIDLWPLVKSPSSGVYFASSLNAKYFFRVCEDYPGPPIPCGVNSATNKTVNCEGNFSLCKCDTVKNVTTTFQVKDRSFVDTSTDAFTEKFAYTPGTNVSVILACSQLVENWLFSLSNNTDQLVFFSKYACVVTENSGLSTGTTLLIFFFFLLVFYFVFGALLLRFLRGARGIEMIPNLEFWKDLPYLVRDGIVFLLAGCKPTTIVTSEAYDRI